MIQGTVQDVLDILGQLPPDDPNYGSGHKEYPEVIYRNVIPDKAWIELYEKDGVVSLAIMVHPLYRRQGIATYLVNLAKHSVRRDIEWYTRRDNEASLKLAQKCGFVVDEKFCNDEWVTLVYKVEE